MAFKLNIGLLALSLSLSLVHLDGVRAGMATRYWDCCLASASWEGKAPVYAPVDACKADGVTLIDSKKDPSGQSGCNGGNKFMCSCMQPFDDETDPTLAFGFGAFTTGQESDTDCACFYAEFEHDAQGKAMKRNKLIFQVTNVGGDVQSQNFDFQIPGGGLGAFPKGCPAQWGVEASLWGDQYGGVKSATECSKLPKPLQEGCKWRFSEWGDNPVLKGSPKRVKCPKSLIDRSGCQRKDDNTISPYSGKVDSANTAAPAQYKRDRSVCLAGGEKGKSAAGGVDGSGDASGGADASGAGGAAEGSQGQPEGYGQPSGGNDQGSSNGDATTGAGSGSGSDSGSTANGSGSGAPTSGSDGSAVAPPSGGSNPGAAQGGQGGAQPGPSGGHKKCHKKH